LARRLERRIPEELHMEAERINALVKSLDDLEQGSAELRRYL
jgi:hypothetical protein